MSLACGIDVGGTKIAGGVVDDDGRVARAAAGRVARHRLGGDRGRDRRPGAPSCASRHAIKAVGVGAAGYVDRDRARVLFAPNLAWRDVDLKVELEARVDLPVVVENDANAAAWGEFRFGAGHDVDDLLLVTVGTGVGGGLVLDGALYRGAFGVAPRSATCGWSPTASSAAAATTAASSSTPAAARWSARPGSWPRTASPLAAGALLERAGGRQSIGIDGPMITEAARDGDAFALERLGRARPLAGRRDRVAGCGARPGRGRDRRWRQRGRRPAARPAPRGVRATTCRAGSTGRWPRSGAPRSATRPG